MVNKQIYVTSLAKAINKAKKYGRLNFNVIDLFGLYTYYIDWAQSTGSTTFNDIVIGLKKEAALLMYKHPDILCNYKVVIENTNTGVITPIPNTAPTVSDNCVDILSATSYQFKVSDFTLNYSDAQGHPWKYLIVYPSITGNGEMIKKGSSPLENPVTYNIEGLSGSATINLFYSRNNTGIFGPDNFSFRISDNPPDYLYSALQTICVNATAASLVNQPPSDIGDRTIYVDNRTTTILTLFDFTGGLQAPYNDPEGDLIDAILIVDISNANQGKFYLNGVEIVEGQIITREDINANLFTHVGPNVDSISSDVFEFKARDEGSQIWIE